MSTDDSSPDAVRRTAVHSRPARLGSVASNENVRPAGFSPSSAGATRLATVRSGDV